MGRIEKFNTEEELLRRIDELKQSGVEESDLQVISQNKLDDNSLDYTDVKHKTSKGSFSDKVTALFSGEEAEERVLTSLNVPENEVEGYQRELQNGKILLYIDNDNRNETKNYDSSHPKHSQAGNEHYDDTKPFSNEGPGVARTDDNEVTNRYGNNVDATSNNNEFSDKNTSAGLAGASGLGAAGYANSKTDNREDFNENDGFRRSRNDDLDNDHLNNDRLDNDRDVLSRRDHDNFDDKDRKAFDRDSKFERNNDRDQDESSMKLHEERLNVDKENVKTGEASVDKHVVEDNQEFDVPVEREEVTIERRPVNEKTNTRFDENDDNDSVRVPLHEERVNVEKEDVVAEEIVVKKNKVQDTEHVNENVRREEADINDTTTDNRDDNGLGRDNDLDRGLDNDHRPNNRR